MPVITIATFIAAPIQVVFDLSRSIDLHKLSTIQTNEVAIAGKTSGLIGEGESVTWRARHFGFYQVLTSKITFFDSPNKFTDEMVNGAFKSFVHQHYFEDKNGVTVMIDVFDYESPLGLLGKMANGLFLKQYMKRLLEKRNQTIKEFAEDSAKHKKILTL
ncbi:SRPBCC family protein [Flavobacterium rakeshii]|uniref:SRPBCC family protein n=1 Tax=Flavobacterium rakeshii TaxID=1038845 RepID=UPI002E7C4868|nr:SRPBCC family protein [Flavobacterium rakeshii]MEE1897655.1 SRPBCC family protein [Flavobacterium rakeshii]